MTKEKAFIKGLSIGIAIGTAIGVATHNLGLWLSLGVAIGAGLGISFREGKKDDETKSP